MGLRVQYSQTSPTPLIAQIEPNLEKAVNKAIESMPNDETLYILPTYSAMLEVRKILTGKKIL